MRTILLLIIMLMLSINTMAEDAVYLNKTQSAPFAGYLLPQDKLVELKNNTLERDSLKLQNTSLNTSLKLQDDIINKKDQQIKLYSDQDDVLAKNLASQQSMTTLERIALVGFGIVITGLSVYGAHQIYK